MTSQEIFAQEERYIMHTYKRFPVALAKGDGVRVWDVDGKSYLDCLAGIAVNALGYNHPVIRETIQQQSAGLIHTSNLFYTQNQITLAKMLTELAGLDKAFFCNSGAEANEGAFKLARKWGKGRYEIITAEQSFHGRTLATITATAQPKYQKGFEPLMPGFKYVPFNDLAAVKAAISPQTVGILLEAVQGEGGIRIADQAYLEGVAALCKEHNLLLMFDEVQAGMGRTGKMFAYQHYNVQPDIITLAKAAAGGFPIGVLLAKKEVADAFEPGNHASTFGGGEFVTGVAIAVLKTIRQENLLAHVVEMGICLLDHLKQVQAKYPTLIQAVRGLGLMAGIEFAASISAADVCQAAIKNGLLTAVAGSNVLRFVPPLIIQPADIAEAAALVDKTLSAFA